MKIKFIATSSILAMVIFTFSAPAAKAVTVEELLTQIAALQAQITALQAQLNQQTQTQQWCYTFNNYLIAGSSGNDVSMLQQALIKDGQTITDYSVQNDGIFTEGTATAVVKFQGKYGITQTGTVGPITRNKLNKLYGCESQLIACTMDVKLCPDGITYVGRTGLDCEFAQCPETTKPSITVTLPNGGEIWRIGETKTITWKTSNVFSPNDKVTLYIALASNLSVHCNIGQELENTGVYSFKVKDPSTYCANAENNLLYRIESQFKLLACVKSEVSADFCDIVRDYSDNAFTISEALPTGLITITSPKPIQTFSQGATIGIAWVFTIPTQSMDVSITDINGQNVGNFFQKVNPSNAYGQSITFFTSSSLADPTYIAPGQYKARVCISDTNNCAISDTYFTVVANEGPIVNLSVNGNESLGYQNPTVNLGKISQATITWSSVGADHCNTYGQTKLKLTDGTTWNKSSLPTSGYAIFNTSGQVDGLGNNMFVASIGVQCWNKDSSVSDRKGVVVTWSTPPANCPVINCVWDPCPGGHSADENGCVNCSTACRPRL